MIIHNRKLLSFIVFVIFIFHFSTVWAVSDTTAPEISDFRFEEHGQVLKAGDTLHVSAIITDESEIESADVCIFRGDETNCLSIYLSYNNNSERWEGSYEITARNKSGNYYIFEVDAYDVYGNRFSMFPSMDHTFSINEIVSDTTAPEISDFRFEEHGQVLKAGDTLHVSAIITDESEIESADVCIFRGDETNCLSIYLSYNNNSERWEGSYEITARNKSGNYYIFEVDAYDVYGNRFSMFPSMNNDFVIENETPDDKYYFEKDENTVQNHLIGSGVDSVFTIKRSENDEQAFSLFRKIQMDGIDVPQKFWKAEQGSVIVTLSTDYMDTLDTGNHILTGVFEDGTLDIAFTVSKPFIVPVKFTSVRGDSSYFIPYDLKDKNLSMTITITGTGLVSKAENIELDLENLIKNRDITHEILFDNEIKDFSNDYKVIVTNYPNKIDADIYVEHGKSPQYNLRIEGAPGQIETDKFGIHIFLIWNDDADSKPEIIAIYALPEDEIGAYAIGPDGMKQYLIFQTFDICMNYLGSEELCKSNERCFHK